MQKLTANDYSKLTDRLGDAVNSLKQQTHRAFAEREADIVRKIAGMLRDSQPQRRNAHDEARAERYLVIASDVLAEYPSWPYRGDARGAA